MYEKNIFCPRVAYVFKKKCTSNFPLVDNIDNTKNKESALCSVVFVWLVSHSSDHKIVHVECPDGMFNFNSTSYNKYYSVA